MSWEVRLHPEVERWYLALCREDPVTADGVTDAIDQLALEGPNARRPWSTGSMEAGSTT